jgi:hypothetical protein
VIECLDWLSVIQLAGAGYNCYRVRVRGKDFDYAGSYSQYNYIQTDILLFVRESHSTQKNSGDNSAY